MSGLKIIMLGKLRSGKSFATNKLIEALGDEGIKLDRKPLAKPIYDAAMKFYEENGLTWRKNRRLMEGMGEALNQDYPAGDKIIELYGEDFDEDQNIIVEDCRRLTQTDFFEKKGAIFIRIHADDEVRKSRCKPGEWAEGHITDTELDNFVPDFIIPNNDDDEVRLNKQILQVVDGIKARLA